MDLSAVKLDLRVKVTRLGSTSGMMINQRHLDCRQVGATGTIKSWVPGHGGDVWFVKHDNQVMQDQGEIGAYCFDEFEPLEEDLIHAGTQSTVSPSV